MRTESRDGMRDGARDVSGRLLAASADDVLNLLLFLLKMFEGVGRRLTGVRGRFVGWNLSSSSCSSSCCDRMLANNVSSRRLGCSLGCELGMREIRGGWVEGEVSGKGGGGGVVVVLASAKSGLVRKRRDAWLREGLREESKVIGAIGVVVS